MCAPPHATHAARRGSKATRVGASTSSAWPNPSWPFWFLPHAWQPPSSASATECAPPHATCTTRVAERALTGLGSSAPSPCASLRPSWRWPLQPKLHGTPRCVSASVCRPPHATCGRSASRGASHATGGRGGISMLRGGSCAPGEGGISMLMGGSYAACSSSSPPKPLSRCGKPLSCRSPRPSCPSLFFPQQKSSPSTVHAAVW